MKRFKYSDWIKVEIPVYLFSKFFLADLAFTLLPLAVTAIILRSLGNLTLSYLTTPEWSFAAIIIYGLAMTRALELKVRYQRDYSERVFVLARMCILGLIAAVVSLALAQMQVSGLQVSFKCLLTLQFVVLGGGIFILFMSHLARELFIHERSRLPESLSLVEYYTFVVRDLESARDNIDRLATRFSRRNTFSFDSSVEAAHFADWARAQNRYIDHLLHELGNCTGRLQQARAQWKEPEEGAQPAGGAYVSPAAGDPSAHP